jgi:Na+/proline symporter
LQLFCFVSRLGTGLTIYAPAIILSALLGWNLTYMNIIIGVLLVIIYTFSGGTKAVNVTQNNRCLSSCRVCLLPFSDLALFTK